MAIPTQLGEDDKFYIVEISMGSQFRGRSWDIDDRNRQIEYKHSKAKRNDIGAIRQQVNTVINGTCMKFHRKIKFTNEKGKEALIAECARADREMKLIDPSLHVTPAFFEQTVTQLNTGNMFELMKDQLNEQVHQRVLDGMERTIENLTTRDENGNVVKVKQITTKTRNALIKMIEGMKNINILKDPTVDSRIEALKAQMATFDLIPMRDELLAYIEDIQGADTLEITPDEIETPGTITPKQEADQKREDEKFKARPMTTADEIHLEDLI